MTAARVKARVTRKKEKEKRICRKMPRWVKEGGKKDKFLDAGYHP